MKKQNKTIKQQLIAEINKIITNYLPNKGLTCLNDDMNNPNDIADYSVTARYENLELYHMYLDVENIIISGENIQYLSMYGRKLKAYKDLGIVSKFFYNISHKEEMAK